MAATAYFPPTRAGASVLHENPDTDIQRILFHLLDLATEDKWSAHEQNVSVPIFCAENPDKNKLCTLDQSPRPTNDKSTALIYASMMLFVI
jgi:hypothetical protein